MSARGECREDNTYERTSRSVVRAQRKMLSYGAPERFCRCRAMRQRRYAR